MLPISMHLAYSGQFSSVAPGLRRERPREDCTLAPMAIGVCPCPRWNKGE